MTKKFSISNYVKHSFFSNKLSYGSSAFLSLLRAANNVAFPYFLSKAIIELGNQDISDDNSTTGDSSEVIVWLCALTGSWLTEKTLALLTEEILLPVSTELSHNITQDVVEASFDLPMLQRITYSTPPCVHHFGISYEHIGRSFSYAIAGRILPAIIDVGTASILIPSKFGSIGVFMDLAVLSSVSLLAASARFVGRSQNDYINGLMKTYAFIISKLDEYANVHYFGAVKRQLDELSKGVTKLDTFLNRSISIRNLALMGESAIVVGLSMLATDIYYIYVFNESISLNEFLWIMFYTMQVAPSFYKLGDATNKLVADYESFKLLIDYLNKAVEEKNEEQPLLSVSSATAEICFNSVNFSYINNQVILDDVDFIVPAGKTVIITGSSGAGKSSVLKLLQRFYRQQSGVISVAGEDIYKVNVESLRAAIAIVPQSPILQNDTIYENIKYANVAASYEEIEEAARMAGLEDLIAQKGFDFVVGGNGAKLSGGQRQRIAIARAYLRKHCPILLMDEPTSSLDPETEKEILVELDKLLHSAKRTTLIVTHRLCVIQYLKSIDNIIYLDQGKVAEQGTFDELIELDGLFAAQMSIARKENDLNSLPKKNIAESSQSTANSRASFFKKGNKSVSINSVSINMEADNDTNDEVISLISDDERSPLLGAKKSTCTIL